MVVGAGPAGAGAAVELVRAGLKTAVVTGRAGAGKPCGGCLSARWRWLVDWLIGPTPGPDQLWSNPVYGAAVAAPNRPPVGRTTASPAAYLIDRTAFNDRLPSLIRAAGAELIPGPVRRVEPVGTGFRIVTAAGAVLEADWLIGADGFGGFTARRIGLAGRNRGLTYLALAEERPAPDHGPAAEWPVLLEWGAAPGGYAWAFNRAGVLNAGICAPATRSAYPKLIADYAAFVDRRDLGWPGLLRGAAIPCPGSRPPRLIMGRAALVGDAGRLADPLLGEGIGQAIYSGRLAGQAVVRGDLNLYQTWINQTLWPESRAGRRAARLCYPWAGMISRFIGRRPSILELGFKTLRAELSQAEMLIAPLRRLRGPIRAKPRSTYPDWPLGQGG